MGINRLFKRKIYKQIMDWKISPVRNSALLIEGARRVGKSTIVEEFAKNEFPDNYLIVDFRKEPDEVKALFGNVKDLDAFFRKFFLSQNRVLREGGLIVFDEVQFCPKAREAIKDFVNDGRYRYIETGSLISIKENTDDIMIPSEERRIDMRPLDFEEFLWAYESNGTFSLLRDEFIEGRKLPLSVHDDYMEKWRTYMLIGGMPKVISIFLETNSFALAREEQQDIIKLYKDDLRKHDNKYGTICGPLFDAIPAQLAKASRRFFISEKGKAERFERIERSINDLCDFRIINMIKRVSSLEGPLALNEEGSKFKLYFCDTGLLLSRLLEGEKSNKAYFSFVIGKKTSLNLGSVYESAIVQELVGQGSNLFYHDYELTDKASGKKRLFELDLVYEKNFKITTIEIKSSKNYTTSSLDNIKNKYPQLKIRRIVCGVKNIKIENDKITIPSYMISLI